MSNKRFKMYEIRQVLVQMRAGATDRGIAQSGLMGREKLAKIRKLAAEQGLLDNKAPLPDDSALAPLFGHPRSRPAVESSVLPWKDLILEWHRDKVQGTAIYAALVRNYHYQGTYSSVRRFLQAYGQEPDGADASVMLEFGPGEAAQADFGLGPRLPDPKTGQLATTWIFVMTLCFSRHQYAEIVFDQSARTWCGLFRKAFEFFGGTVSRVIIDNPKCAITKACYYDPEVQRSFGELAEGYGFQISPCPVRDPEKKGRVESGVKYVKGNFLPLRTFRSFADANRQLQEWVLETAGTRSHGTTRRQPFSHYLQSEKPFLKPLPDHPVEIYIWHRTKKAPSQCHLLIEDNYYSFPYTLVGKELWAKTSETMVWIYEGYTLKAVHPRLLGSRQISKVLEHMPPKAQDFPLRDPAWCRKRAEAVGPACQKVVEALFDDKVLDNLRGVQGILSFADKNGAERLEAACERAWAYGSPRYATIKTILNHALDTRSVEETVSRLPEIYRNGTTRFARPDTSPKTDTPSTKEISA